MSSNLDKCYFCSFICLYSYLHFCHWYCCCYFHLSNEQENYLLLWEYLWRAYLVIGMSTFIVSCIAIYQHNLSLIVLISKASLLCTIDNQQQQQHHQQQRQNKQQGEHSSPAHMLINQQELFNLMMFFETWPRLISSAYELHLNFSDFHLDESAKRIFGKAWPFWASSQVIFELIILWNRQQILFNRQLCWRVSNRSSCF